MARSKRQACRQCRQLQAQLAVLQQEVRALREQLATARKDSSTSSKPPSSDIVKPARPGADPDDTCRAPGGQPGHPPHKREPFPPEQVTHFEEHRLEACPCCGGRLRRNGKQCHIVQQVEILQPPLRIEQHTSYEYWCRRCQQSYDAPLPTPIVQGGLVGPHLTALIAYLKGVCHASFSTVRKFLRDVVGVTLSRGQLSKIIGKVSAALAEPYEELLLVLPDEPFLNVDETGHKDNGDRWWTWCFRAELYTLFRIDPRRSADVLVETLGAEFEGVLGCDYFGAYRKYQKNFSILIQFCLAHLIRDVKFLTTLPDARTRRYGEGLRDALRELFAVFHEVERTPGQPVPVLLVAAKAVVLHAGLNDVPPTRHAQNMARRLRQHGEAYFTFLTSPDVEPTNNLAEQAIRFVVIDRLITQGTRSATGRHWSERIWTVIATCVQQGKSVYGYLRAAVERWFWQQPAPTLLSD